MNSEIKKNYSYSQIVQSSEIKMALQRKSTQSNSQYNKHHDQINLVDQFNQNQSIQPPSPLESSRQQQSIQVKYLSYLVQVIDSAPQKSDNVSQMSQHFQNAQYWCIVYESAIYVKKDKYRTQIDDNLYMDQISSYFKQNRIHPEPLTKIGQQILTNGYFAIAYSILIARKRKSCFIFNYLMQYFLNQCQILQNKQEFMYIVENYIDANRVEQLLLLQIQNTPGQHQRNNIKQQNNDDNHLIRRNVFLESENNNRFNYQLSDQGSKTIILEQRQIHQI